MMDAAPMTNPKLAERKNQLACKQFLESSRMSIAYNDGADTFRPYIREAISLFGDECVKMMLAYTARNLNDARIDRVSKKWAKDQPSIFQFEGTDDGKACKDERSLPPHLMINKHPTILNQAIREIIKMDRQPVRGGVTR